MVWSNGTILFPEKVTTTRSVWSERCMMCQLEQRAIIKHIIAKQIAERHGGGHVITHGWVVTKVGQAFFVRSVDAEDWSGGHSSVNVGWSIQRVEHHNVVSRVALSTATGVSSSSEAMIPVRPLERKQLENTCNQPHRVIDYLQVVEVANRVRNDSH